MQDASPDVGENPYKYLHVFSPLSKGYRVAVWGIRMFPPVSKPKEITMTCQTRSICLLTVLLAALGLAGCATPDEVNSAAAAARQAQATADAALARATEAGTAARNAQTGADEAKAAAGAAMKMSSEAKAEAENTKAACRATEEKCNRMFQKSLQK